MSQELLYHVRLKLKQGDVASVEKELNRLEKDRSSTKAQKETDKATRESTKALKEKESTLKALRKELREYKEQLADVQREARESGGATEKNIELQRSLAEAIASTKRDIEAASRGNVDYDTALKNTGLNLREMKGNLRALKLAIDEVKDPLGEGAEEVAKLTKEHDTLNASIGKVEKSMGVHTRNVGNYEDSIRSAANAVAIFQGPLGPLAGRINSAATAISRYRAASAAGTKATLTFAAAIRTALIASGIGALIVAFTSLLAFFKRTEEGQQKLRVITAALGAIFETFADRSSALGKALFEAFQSPQESLERLWNGVKNFGQSLVSEIVDRVKAIPDLFSGMIDGVIGSFSFLGAKVKLALADVPLLGGSIDTEKAERQLQEANERIVQGVIKTGEAIKKIYNVDFAKDLFDGAVAGAKELFNTVSDNVAQSIEDQQKMNEILVRERKLLVERAEMSRDTAKAREDSRNLDIEAEKRLQSILAVRAQEEEMLEKELTLERNRLEVMESIAAQHDSNEKTLRELDEQRAKIANMEEAHAKTMMSLTRDQTAVERQMREQTMREARLEFEQRMGFRNIEIERQAQALELMGRMLEAERLRQNETEIELAERKHLRLAQLQAEFENQRFSAEEAAQLAHNQWEIEEAERLLEAKKRLRDLELQAEQQKLQAISNFIGASNKAFFGDAKSLAVAQTIIDTYAGVQKALAAPPGFPFNAVNAAAVAAQGIANVRAIMSTQLGSTSVNDTSQAAPKPSFGLVDIPGIGAEIASQQAPAQDFAPTIVLDGEFDPEFLSIKVRQGTDSISGRAVTI